MRRPLVRAGWLAGLAAALVVGCSPAAGPSGSAAIAPAITPTAPASTDAATPAPSGEPTASGSDVPASAVPSVRPSPDADACTIVEPPGPADDPPSGGETGPSDQGGGRYALCLLGPPGDRLEGTAYCTWTPDRIAVQDVSGLPTLGGAGMYDAYLDLRAGSIQVSLTLVDGTIVTYAQADVPGAIRDDGTDGLVAFDAPLADGSAAPPPGTPPRQTGTVRWQCAAPPPA